MMMGQPACLHPLLIFMMFYEDDIQPEMQVPPAISAIHPEQLYQEIKLSATGDESIDNRWC